MIEVVYYRKKHKVTVKGHANAAPKGEDLVCAAASALICTLAQDIDNLSSASHSICRRPKIKLDAGDAVVSVEPIHGFDNTVKVIFDTICVGFELLAAKEPGYITYKIV